MLLLCFKGVALTFHYSSLKQFYLFIYSVLRSLFKHLIDFFFPFFSPPCLFVTHIIVVELLADFLSRAAAPQMWGAEPRGRL